MKARAVGLVAKSLERYDSEWGAIQAVAVKIGCSPDTLRSWVRQSEAEEDKRLGVTPAERQRRKDFWAAVLRLVEPLMKVDPDQVLRRPKTVMERVGKRLAEDLISRIGERSDEQILRDLAWLCVCPRAWAALIRPAAASVKSSWSMSSKPPCSRVLE